MQRYLGIDFSGGASPWKMKCKHPTVWIATICDDQGYVLTDLRPVQDLDGDEEPFDRLVNFLALGDFTAAAIDAPFALPSAHMPNVSYSRFLARVRVLPNGMDRPFPRGTTIVEMGESISPKGSTKPYRRTEKYWANRGVNTRSTMWNGPRGGAPFAAACLSLLSRINRPIWPWHPVSRGVLVEAFPAAQLRQWGLPHQGYSGDRGQANRKKIIGAIAMLIKLDFEAHKLMIDSADALDSVIACFATIAVSNNRFEPTDHSVEDGMISVLCEPN